MKNYALLDENNKVVNISVANENWDSTGWIEYTNSNPAFMGGDYVDGYFYPPKPYPSWLRSNGIWNPPVDMPTDNKRYICDETTTSWIEIT
jgi:hypothetical protein